MSKTRAKAEDVTDVTLPCLQAAADDGQLASQSLGHEGFGGMGV